MSLKAIESAELILRNIEFSEDSKAKSPSNVAYFPPILFFKIITILFFFIVVIKNKNKIANKQ